MRGKSRAIFFVIFAVLMIGFVGGMETAENLGVPLAGALISLAGMIFTAFYDRDDRGEEE